MRCLENLSLSCRRCRPQLAPMEHVGGLDAGAGYIVRVWNLHGLLKSVQRPSVQKCWSNAMQQGRSVVTERQSVSWLRRMSVWAMWDCSPVGSQL